MRITSIFLCGLLVCLLLVQIGPIQAKTGEKNVLIIANSKDSSGQGHPRIYAGSEPKKDFFQRVNKIEWKNRLIERKKEGLEKYLKLWRKEPDWLVSRLQMNWKTKHSNVYLRGGKFSHSDGGAPVPTVRYSGTRDWATEYSSPDLEDVIPYLDDDRGLYLQRKDNKKWEWVEPPSTGHIIEGINRKIMRLAEDAALMYWMTGDEKYAEFATPIFFHYMDGMYYRNAPEVLDDSSQNGISGLATFEVIHEAIVVSLAVTYDFLFDYFNKEGKDLSRSQAVFQKWGDQIIKNGVPDNNWNLFQARFLTYIAMVLEDDTNYANGKGQQYYLKYTFDTSTDRQIAIKESLLVYDQENGIWPESASYSMHVTTTLLEILTLLDHLTNGNELANYPIVEKAALAAFQYLFPSGHTVGFGDSGHKIIPPENFELLIANYRKYGQKDKESTITGLLQDLIRKGQYERKGRGMFELFFYVDELGEAKPDDTAGGLVTPTFYAPNVSMFIQRLGEGQHAMMVSTVGSYGNHAHSNGISIELYANNYVLGPDMGRGASYWHPDHREYYSQFPAHNTVVVDGISRYNSMRSYNPYTLDNCFPKPLETPEFKKATFSKVSFIEPKTMSNQQRLTAQVQTNLGPGYVLDIFRSGKIIDTTQVHDYFYHNLGQTLQIFDKKGELVDLSATHELTSENGEQKAYDYFTDKRKVVLNDDFSALFTLKSQGQTDNLMKMWVKGQSGQQIYTVNGPRSKAISKGTAPQEMIGASIPAIILRRNQAAWNSPFISVFNPTKADEQNPIREVTFREDGFGTQIVEVDMINGSRDMITTGQSESSYMKNNGIEQHGLLSIVRRSGTGKVDFLMLAGVNVFKYGGWEIISQGKPCTVTIESTENGLLVQNDQPVLLRITRNPGFFPATMSIYKNDGLIETRKGEANRHDPNQVVFRLAEAYDKAVIN